MAIFRISTGLKQELYVQRNIIFGKRRYWFHIALWLLVLGYLFIGAANDLNSGVQAGNGAIEPKSTTITIQNIPVQVLLPATIIAAAMVYFYLLLVIPYANYKKKKRYLWLGLLINALLWLAAIIGASIFLVLTHKNGGDNNNMVISSASPESWVVVAMISSIFSGVLAGYFFSLYYFIDLYDQQKNLNQYKKVLTDKLAAETNFLKMQINPHFLFNTLNNIYSLSLSRSNDTVIISRQLKELISYMLYECSKDRVPLSGEIMFMENYVYLEKLRNKKENVNIEFHVLGDPQRYEIAPLLLINFIENAFKHGVKAGVDHAYVKVTLIIMDGTLTMDMINSKPELPVDKRKAITEGSGIGIQNVKRRLSILYPEKHTLQISESPREYSVHLSIDL